MIFNESIKSNSLCVAFSLRIIILVIIELQCPFPFPFQHFLVIWILFSFRLLVLLLFLLPFHGICHFNICKLFEGHCWQVVPWLEYLLLILALERHPVVDIILLHMDSFDWLELAHWIDVLLHYLWLLLLLSSLTRL